MSDETVELPTPAGRPNSRMLRHQLLAKILELVLTPVDITVESELQVMSEPPKADLLLLRRHGDVWSEAQRKLLPNEPQNEFLRLFASQQRVRKQTLDEVLQDPMTLESEPLLAAVFGLQRLYQMEDEAMKQELTVDDVMAIGDKLRKQAIASASVKERLAGLAPEEMLAALPPEVRLAGLAPEERLAGLGPEERLAGLTPEEMARLRSQLDALLAKQPAPPAKHRKPSSKR